MARVSKGKVSYHKDLMERLRDPEFAMEYLRAALEEGDMPEVFLLALRRVAESRGMSRLAREAHLNRENLYRMLGEKGNPELGSLCALLDALGLRLSVEMKRAS